MTKSEFADRLGQVCSMTKKQAAEVVDAFVETVTKAVKKGEDVRLPGLGVFRIRKMKARMGRNPQTGEAIKIPARQKVAFTTAKAFKDAVIGRRK